jgi:hypothetical protein
MFQQDEVPPHFQNAVTTFLLEQLPGLWIGRGGPVTQSHYPLFLPLRILKDPVYVPFPKCWKLEAVDLWQQFSVTRYEKSRKWLNTNSILVESKTKHGTVRKLFEFVFQNIIYFCCTSVRLTQSVSETREIISNRPTALYTGLYM